MTRAIQQSDSGESGVACYKSLSRCEIAKNAAMSLLAFFAAMFFVTSTVLLLHFYFVVRPDWQTTWMQQFFGNLDKIAVTVNDGSIRLGNELSEIRAEMVGMNISVTSMDQHVADMSIGVNNIDISARGMNQSAANMVRIMGSMDLNVDQMQRQFKMPFMP